MWDAIFCVYKTETQDQSQMYSCLPSLSPQPTLCFVSIITLILNALMLDCIWNVMPHTQKPDFIFWRNGQVHLNQQGCHLTTGSRCVCISGSNAGYAMFRGSVKNTGYPLHSPVSPSLPLPCVTVCHHISTGLYSVVISLHSLYTPFPQHPVQ